METERLILRRFTLADAAFALRLLNEPSFIKNIGDRGVRTLEQAERYLTTGPLTGYAKNGHGLEAVELKGSRQVIGMCGSTGWSTGPHVHFELRINGEYVDPAPYIAANIH